MSDETPFQTKLNEIGDVTKAAGDLADAVLVWNGNIGIPDVVVESALELSEHLSHAETCEIEEDFDKNLKSFEETLAKFQAALKACREPEGDDVRDELKALKTALRDFKAEIV